MEAKCIDKILASHLTIHQHLHFYCFSTQSKLHLFRLMKTLAQRHSFLDFVKTLIGQGMIWLKKFRRLNKINAFKVELYKMTTL